MEYECAAGCSRGSGWIAQRGAKAVHWDGAKDEEVIVQIVGQGPGGSTLVDSQQPFFVKIGD
jgi:hypothetical protein